MAFNVMHTFHRNKRFWMAAILMVCMVSFVFCTGIKGGMDDFFLMMIGRRGTTVYQIGGRNYSVADLNKLRMQRNLANKLLINCTDLAIRKLNKEFFDLDKKQDAAPGKEAQARQERLAEIEGLRQVLAYKKNRPRYFEGGVKYEDLVEFTMWLSVADKLGINLDEGHVQYLYYMEFYANRIAYDMDQMRSEINVVESQTHRDFPESNPATIRRALTDEFRVRIAQEAVLLSQPMQFLGRMQDRGVKVVSPDVPDEVRTPITLAQLWDQFKQTRAEFDVTLLPLYVDKFTKNIQAEPTEAEKKAFFDANKDKPADPSSDARGLQMPVRVKIEYVLADPTAPAYLNAAKTFEALRVTPPVAPDIFLSPLAVASRYWAADVHHNFELQMQYAQLGKNDRQGNYVTTPFSERDCVTPILAWAAKRYPEANAGLLGHTFLTPTDGFGAIAGHLAWGAMGRPSDKKETLAEVRQKHEEAIEAAVRAELKRRAPVYATVLAASASQFPLDMAAPYLVLPFFDYPLPLEAVKKEIEEILVRRAAEQQAQKNMQTVRAALAQTDEKEEKFRRDLKNLVPELNLTYGPADKNAYITRYSADTAPEVEPLRKAYAKYLDTINMFEGRDVTPERLLKPGDFYKLFFDSSEPFAAITPYKPMPWPPRVKPNAAQMFSNRDPRLIKRENIDPRSDLEFKQHLKQINPLQPVAPPPFEGLFSTADKPILFWRTAERIPPRPAKYSDIARDITLREADVKKIQADMKKVAEFAPQVDALRKKEADLIKANADPKEIDKVKTERLAKLQILRNLQKEAGGDLKTLTRKEADAKEDVEDLKEIERLIVSGWKFERARASEVLPVARTLADTFIKKDRQGLEVEAAKLGSAPFSVKDLCPMFPEKMMATGIDYGKPPLPKDDIPYPRADMIDQLINLDNLAKPITIGNDAIYKVNKEIADLDELNRDLFERVKKTDNPRGHYVQILTNKPRSVYYLAFTPTAAEAKKRDFVTAMMLAPFDSRMGFLPRDRWVQRMEERDGRAYRTQMVESLKTMLKYEEVSPESRKLFDDRVVGD